MRRALGLGAALALLAVLAPGASAADHARAVDLRVHPIERFHPLLERTRFGALTFLGGVHIASGDPLFGGWSGVRVVDGRVVAVSDSGYWFDARLVRTDGRIVGVERMRVAPMLDERGKPFSFKWQIDTEGLERRPGGGWLVSTERDNRIIAFAGDPFEAPLAGQVTHRFELASGRRNRGLEAIAIDEDSGTLIVIAEDGRRFSKTIEGFATASGDPGAPPRSLTVRKRGNYAVTDAAFLPGGDLLILERRFDLATGPGMRIRRIEGAALRRDGLLDGEVLIDVGLPHQVDNMEGLAVTPHPRGHRLTLVSDDNRSLLQRTLLLEFLLEE